jgi:hypothetical protein
MKGADNNQYKNNDKEKKSPLKAKQDSSDGVVNDSFPSLSSSSRTTHLLGIIMTQKEKRAQI